MDLFKELKLGSMTLRNRIVMAPMTRSRASDNGIQPDFAIKYYSQRATAGLIITEGTYPSLMGKGYVRTPGICTEEQIIAWKKITEEVHKRNGKIFCQLMHTGRISLPDFLPGKSLPLAPSPVKPNIKTFTDEGMKDIPTPREVELHEIPKIIEEYKMATINAVKAGFDGVELHCASGYLPEQFLSTKTNLRKDNYGGNLENRLRFVLEVLDAMSKVKGPQYIGIKISPEMNFNDISDENPIETYSKLVDDIGSKGLAYLHVALFGTQTDYHSILRSKFKGVYFAGGGFTKTTAEDFLNHNKADGIVFGSLFLANPDLPDRFRQNAKLNEPDKATFYTPGEKGYTDYPFLSLDFVK